MATRSVFNPDKLRDFIKAKTPMAEIKAKLKVTTTTLNNHLLKLMQLDNTVYILEGSGVRNTVPRVTKNGLKITKSMLDSCGFTEGKVKIEKVNNKEIKITQID